MHRVGRNGLQRHLTRHGTQTYMFVSLKPCNHAREPCSGRPPFIFLTGTQLRPTSDVNSISRSVLHFFVGLRRKPASQDSQQRTFSQGQRIDCKADSGEQVQPNFCLSQHSGKYSNSQCVKLKTVRSPGTSQHPAWRLPDLTKWLHSRTIAAANSTTSCTLYLALAERIGPAQEAHHSRHVRMRACLPALRLSPRHRM